eukprot:3961461-Pyramimonas_sp.AAC.1
MVSLKNLLRDNMQIWRSANDIIMSAGRGGRIPPTHVVQLIGAILWNKSGSIPCACGAPLSSIRAVIFLSRKCTNFGTMRHR